MATKPMTSAQREHAKTRAEQIAKRAKLVVTEKHTTTAVRLNETEKMAKIMAGAVKLKKGVDKYTYLISAYDFSSFEKEAVFSPAGKAKHTKIDKALEAAIDNIMLGDSEEALAGLKAFEAAVAKI